MSAAATTTIAIGGSSVRWSRIGWVAIRISMHENDLLYHFRDFAVTIKYETAEKMCRYMPIYHGNRKNAFIKYIDKLKL